MGAAAMWDLVNSVMLMPTVNRFINANRYDKIRRSLQMDPESFQLDVSTELELKVIAQEVFFLVLVHQITRVQGHILGVIKVLCTFAISRT